MASLLLRQVIWFSYQKLMKNVNVRKLRQYREPRFRIGIMCQILSTLNRDKDIRFRCDFTSISTILHKRTGQLSET